MAPAHGLAAASSHAHGLAAAGGRESSLCLSRSRSWTAISQSALSGSASPIVEAPPNAYAAPDKEEQIFLTGVPRILALLERLSAAQQRLEVKFDSMASVLRREGGGRAAWGSAHSEGDLPMSHTSSTELSLAQLGAMGQQASVAFTKPLEGLPLPLERASRASFPASDVEKAAQLIAAAAGGGDGKEEELSDNASILDEELMLPKRWPASLRIREGLTGESAPVRRKTRRLSNAKRPSLAVGRFSSMSAAGEGYGHALCSLSMLDPSSRFLLVWHIVSACVLLYDLIMIPYALAWDLALHDGVFFVAGWCHAGFWIMDLVLVFRTGYYQRAELVLDPRRVAANYLASWFLLDAFLVVCDVMSMLAATDFTGRALNLLRMSKLGRILRIAGVLRMYRLVQLVERHMLDGQYKLTAKVLSIIMQMICFNHVASCAWFAIGVYAPTDTGEHWVDNLAASSQPDIYEYVSALHWSVAQFTMGATDIICTNSVERAFTICFLLLGLIWSSTIISSLSATAIDYQIARADTLRKVRQVAQFFREHHVDRKVASQVHAQVGERLWRKESLLYSDVEAFAVLSTSLQRSLQYELFKRYFKPHGLFRIWGRLERNTVQEICHYACKYIVIMRMDDIFMPGAPAKGAYYLAAGHLQYMQSSTSAPVEEDETVEAVLPGTWVAEAALWTYWTHVGHAEALEPSQLLMMNGDALAKALQNTFLVRQVTVAYCQQFHRNLLLAHPPRRQWPNDLRVPFTDYGTLVMGMDQEVQEVIGLDAIEQLYGGNGRLPSLRANVDALVDEVKSGSTVIVLSSTGNDLERLVWEVSLRVQDDEARVLVEVARQESVGGHILPGCRLPWGKQLRGEQPEAAVQRLIDTELAFLKGRTELENMEQEEEVKRSAKYAIPTKYLRTVCNARLTMELEPLVACRAVVATPSQPSQAGAQGRMGSQPRPMGKVMSLSVPVRRMFSTTRSSVASWHENATATSVPSHGAGAGAPQNTTELLSSIGLFVSGDEGRLSFYSWVTPSQLHALEKTPDRMLRQWVDHRANRMMQVQVSQAERTLPSETHIGRTSQASTFGEHSTLPSRSSSISPRR